MKLTLKEIAISHWEESVELSMEIFDMLRDFLTDFIPEMCIEFPMTVITELTYCLNIFGKILVWPTLGPIMFIIGFAMSFMFLVLSFLIFLVYVIFVIQPAPLRPYDAELAALTVIVFVA